MAGEEAVTDEKLERDAFAATIVTASTPETVEAPVVEVAAEPVPTTETPPAAPAPEPEYAQLTKAEVESLRAVAAQTTEFGTKLDRALGTFGNFKQIVEKLQSATPAGMRIKVRPGAFAKLEADFPELAAQLHEAIEGLEGTAPEAEAPIATPAPAVDSVTVESLVESALAKKEAERQAEALKKEAADFVKAHPSWRSIVGQVDVSKGQVPPADNAFRAWLKAQPADYQQAISETDSPREMHQAVDKFLAAQKLAAKAPPPKTPAPRGEVRRDRIRSAIQPTGDGSSQPPPGAMTEEQAMRAAFRGS